MVSQTDIAHQQNLLRINRARLKVLLEQQTTMGTFTPAYVRLEIDSARSQIRDIKRILSGWKVAVDDLPGDEPPAPDPAPAEAQPAPAPATSATPPSGQPLLSEPAQGKSASSRKRKPKGGPDVYISYNQADKVWVRDELLPRIEEAGLQVIVDWRDFEIGVPKLVNIERAVERTGHTLIVMTPDWL